MTHYLDGVLGKQSGQLETHKSRVQYTSKLRIERRSVMRKTHVALSFSIASIIISSGLIISTTGSLEPDTCLYYSANISCVTPVKMQRLLLITGGGILWFLVVFPILVTAFIAPLSELKKLDDPSLQDSATLDWFLIKDWGKK